MVQEFSWYSYVLVDNTLVMYCKIRVLVHEGTNWWWYFDEAARFFSETFEDIPGIIIHVVSVDNVYARKTFFFSQFWRVFD